MDKITVLLAEDEPALAHIVRESLEERDFKVVLCSNGADVLEQYAKQRPDIMALDVMMPKIDGFEVAKKIRETNTDIPIIFITARSQVKDVVTGFEIGANDYLKKPFSVEELIVRIKVLLSAKRMLNTVAAPKPPDIIAIGNLHFNPAKNLLQNYTVTIPLTARESELLHLLARDMPAVVSRKVLLQKLWGDDSFFNARSLDVFISKLRKILLADKNVQIINIRGIGYKLVW